MKAQTQIGFRLKPNKDLWIYLLEQEDEFYLTYDFWSDPTPIIVKHDKETIFQDVLVTKSNYTASKNCTSRTDVSYIGNEGESLRLFYIISNCCKHI